MTTKNLENRSKKRQHHENDDKSRNQYNKNHWKNIEKKRPIRISNKLREAHEWTAMLRRPDVQNALRMVSVSKKALQQRVPTRCFQGVCEVGLEAVWWLGSNMKRI